MENPLERERSLKKLHFCIANYRPSPEDHSALQTAQQDLRDKIELKFRKSNANQAYVFPRKVAVKEEYADAPETVSLHVPPEPVNEGELRQKPKIKLAKGRAEKQLKTEHFDRGDENAVKGKWEDRRQQYQSRPLCQSSQNYPAPTMPIKDRLRTQHSNERRKLQTPPFLNSLQKQGGLSRGKSKLNMLTKSYMNLKSGKPLQFSMQQAANSIRTNDYKFMPSSTNHRTHNSVNPAGFNSTREFKMVPSEPDPKSLEKLEALLPSRKYFKGK